MSTKTPRRCSRCKDTLPEGSNYCVSCGCNNEGATYDKMLKSEAESRKRIASAKRERNFWKALRGLWFWS